MFTSLLLSLCVRASTSDFARRCDVGAQDVKSIFDMADNHIARPEVGIVAPRAVKLRRVAGRVDVKEGDLLEHALGDVGQVQDAQSSAVVGLVHQTLMGHVSVER